MQVQPGAGEVAERLRHERCREACPVRQGVDHVPVEDDPIRRGERVGVGEVLLELAVRVLVIVGVVRPPEPVHVLRHRRQVVEHPGQALGVIARRLRPVERVRELDPAAGGPPDEEVLRLAADVVHQSALACLLQHSLEDQPRGVWPRLALDVDVALQHSEPRLPGCGHVGSRIRHRDHVGIRRALAHRASREPGEAHAPADQDIERLDGNHLGAGLSVHVDEHGEEELDAVRRCPCPEIILDVRHALSP